MKRYVLSFFLIIGVSYDAYTGQAPLPSVADVFGNMSEEEITKQVQMGQQFLADLEKYGTPEEKAEFEKILLDTLNSMSEQDFQDIQNIAKMVEPHLQTPEVQPAVQPTPSKPEEVVPNVSQDATEKIKNLIAAIINRIDEILQKIESCKDCKEEFDLRWSNRATLSSIKRHIAHLKTTKLAEKLSKKDLSDDDKNLVELLENFLKQLTEKNNKFIVEDNFGLTDNKDLEKKYLRQTKDIIEMFDSYLDALAPKLEKFLSKWDPEALQLAKEAAQKTDKATQDAKDALKRVASPDARASVQDRTSGRSSYRDYDSYPDMYGQYGYSPDMYNQYSGQGYQDSDQEGFDQGDSKSYGKSGTASANSANSAKDAVKDKAVIDQKVKEDKANSGTLDDIMDSIDSHFDRHTDTEANKNISFLNDVVSNGYKALTPAFNAKVITWGKTEEGDDAHGAKPNTEGVTEWILQSFAPYTQTVSKGLETDYQGFTNELDSAKRLCFKIENSVKDLSSDDIKKVSEKVTRLENRITSYNQAYHDTMTTIEDGFKRNFSKITDRVIVGDEVQESSIKPIQAKEVQNKLVAKLKNDIGDKVSNLMADINVLKSNMDRKAKRKSKSSKSSSLVMNTNA